MVQTPLGAIKGTVTRFQIRVPPKARTIKPAVLRQHWELLSLAHQSPKSRGKAILRLMHYPQSNDILFKVPKPGYEAILDLY